MYSIPGSVFVGLGLCAAKSLSHCIAASLAQYACPPTTAGCPRLRVNPLVPSLNTRGDGARVQLHPVTDVLAGTLLYPPGRILALLQAFVKFVATASDEMNTIGSVLSSERGTRFRMLVFNCGHPSQENELLKPLRALKPMVDNVRVMPYLEAQAAVFLPAPIAHFKRTCFFRN